MNSHFFSICHLSFLVLILILVPTSSGSDNEQYTNCSQPVECANIGNLAYPFWGGNRPQYCGHPNFRLNCTNQAPQITINSIPYRILSISYPTKTLTVARAEFWNDPCSSPSTLQTNDTLDGGPFAYSDDSQNMMIMYGCLAVPVVTLANQFSCTDNGITTASYFGLTSGVDAPKEFATFISGCKSSVIVRVNQTVALDLKVASPSSYIEQVLDSGFGLQWDANDSICSGCARSGGVCGSDSGSGFACYCWDKVYPAACNSTGRGNDCSTVNKRLLEFSDDGVIQALFAHGQQQAHALLDYVPSYRGFLSREKSPRPSTRRRRSRSAVPDEQLEQLWGKERRPRTEMAGATDRPTLAQLRQQQQRDRRARAPRPSAGASQRREREEQPGEQSDPAAKRLRVGEPSAQSPPPRATEAQDVPERGADASATTNETEGQEKSPGDDNTLIPTNREVAGGSRAAPPEAWAPSFTGLGGVRLTRADSVRADPEVANILLKGLALPVDMSSVNAGSLDDNFTELHSCLVKASQASVAVHKKAVAMASASRAAAERLKVEKKAAEQMKAEIEGLGKKLEDLNLEKQGAEGRIKAAEDRASAAEADARIAEERAKAAEDKAKDAIDRAKAAEDRLAELEASQALMLAAANEDGFKRGEEEAGKQYVQESADMEVAAFRKGYLLASKDLFPRAYLRGVDACNAPPDAEARIVPEAPEPEVPEMPMDDFDEAEEPEANAEDPQTEATDAQA